MKRIIISLLALLPLTGCEQKATTYIHPSTAQLDSNLILPPSWAFGVIYGAYTNQEGTIQRVNEIIEHDYPIDAYWIDSWFWSYADQGIGPHKYMDFVADTVDYPDRKGMWTYLEERNIKGGFWAWDCIFETGNEQAFRDFDEKGYFRSKYYETNPWHNKSTSTAMHASRDSKDKGTHTGNIDFNNPEAVKYFKERMKHFFDEGADFIKLDRTSAIPVCKVMFEMSQEFGKETEGRGFILSHTGGMETEEYKRYPTKWTDDTRTDWTVENPTKEFNSWVPHVAHKENIAMYTNLDPKNRRSNEIAFMTNDLGGFDMGLTDQLDDELYIRWLQFSFFAPVVEVLSQPENKSGNMAYKISERADKAFREYAHLRMEMFPYIYSYAHLTRLESKNMMRLLDGQLYEYCFGEEFFVAPVYEQGATTREAKFPAGTWIDYWTGEEYEGGKVHTVAAPIERLPLFVLRGAIVPKRAYARSIEAGTNDLLTLEVYPGAKSKFTLLEDDGRSNDYINGIYAKTELENEPTDKGFRVTLNPTLGSYKGMSAERRWILSVPATKSVKKVKVDGKDVAFSMNNGRIITETFTTSKIKKSVVEVEY